MLPASTCRTRGSNIQLVIGFIAVALVELPVAHVRAAVGEGAAELYPELTGSAARTRSRDEDSPRPTELDASWEIDLFGRVRQTARAARLSARAEEAAFVGAYTSLSAEVADDYVQYRACRMIEAVYREAVGSQQETRRATAELASS